MSFLFSNNKRSFLVPALLFIAALIYACGSGGGGVIGASDATLFITDSPLDGYRQVIVTVYKVEFENASDGSMVTAFEDAQGVTYDFSELDGILSKLSTLAPGSYRNVYITVGQEIILVDNAGIQVSPNPLITENPWTSCPGSQCIITVNGAANIASNQKVVLDFNLKEFIYDPVTNTVSAKVVLDADGSSHEGYHETDDEDDYDAKGSVGSIGIDSFQLTIMKTEHFMPDSNVITVNVTGNTVYECDDNDNISNCTFSAFFDLQPGMKVKIDGTWDGSEFHAVKVELDGDDDLNRPACTIPVRSIADFTITSQQTGADSTSYSYNSNNHSITVNTTTILITRETVIKDETGIDEKHICTDSIPFSAGSVEVKYHQATNGSGAAANIAKKIEFKN